MKNEFVPYKPSLRLKALGFDEPCIGYYHVNEGYTKGYAFCYFNVPKRFEDGSQHFVNDLVAPTFSQAFRFFRKKYNLLGAPQYFTGGFYCYIVNDMKDTKESSRLFTEFETFEEAELACLTKLIEIVESK